MQEVQQENALAASLQPLETQVAALATSVTAMQTQFGATDADRWYADQVWCCVQTQIATM